jgi:integrase/recombinase XerD
METVPVHGTLRGGFLNAQAVALLPELLRNSLSNSVASFEVTTMPRYPPNRPSFLHTPSGERKYLSRDERSRALHATARFPPDRALFCLTLAWTGARISEVLDLRPADFQIDDGLITLRTLKRRGLHVREIPIPPNLMRLLAKHYRLREHQADPDRCRDRLWTFHRITAWRIVKCVMAAAGLHGPAACPKAFRHSFGTGAIQAGIPVTLLQRWLGHARLSTTAIYTAVTGPEEFGFAAKYWRWSRSARRA